MKLNDQARIEQLALDFKNQVIENFRDAGDLLLTDTEIRQKIEQLMAEQQSLLIEALSNLEQTFKEVWQDLFLKYQDQLRQQIAQILGEKIDRYTQERQPEISDRIEALTQELLAEFKQQCQNQDERFFQSVAAELREQIGLITAPITPTRQVLEPAKLSEHNEERYCSVCHKQLWRLTTSMAASGSVIVNDQDHNANQLIINRGSNIFVCTDQTLQEGYNLLPYGDVVDLTVLKHAGRVVLIAATVQNDTIRIESWEKDFFDNKFGHHRTITIVPGNQNTKLIRLNNQAFLVATKQQRLLSRIHLVGQGESYFITEYPLSDDLQLICSPKNNHIVLVLGSDITKPKLWYCALTNNRNWLDYIANYNLEDPDPESLLAIANDRLIVVYPERAQRIICCQLIRQSDDDTIIRAREVFSRYFKPLTSLGNSQLLTMSNSDGNQPRIELTKIETEILVVRQQLICCPDHNQISATALNEKTVILASPQSTQIWQTECVCAL